ncbi:MAG: polysaccharide biosynthesis C-terminal domain-containing protein, partial [Lutispora sp.]
AEKLLFWSSIPCILEYWLFVLIAIMSGIGLQRKVLESSILNILIMVLSIIILIPMPLFNIYGYVIGFTLSSLSVVLKCLDIINKKTSIRIDMKRCILKPAFCSLPMLVLIGLTNYYLTSNTSFRFNMILSYVLGLIIYFMMLFITKTLKPNQLLNVIGLKTPKY